MSSKIKKINVSSSTVAALFYAPKSKTSACNCVGPQNGEPLCPCRMSSVKVQDGRYVEVRDLGPAPKTASNGEGV